MFYTSHCVDVKTKKIFKDICHSNSIMFKALLKSPSLRYSPAD